MPPKKHALTSREAPVDPSGLPELEAAMARRIDLQRRIRDLEIQIYEKETTFLSDAMELGSVFDGFGTLSRERRVGGSAPSEVHSGGCGLSERRRPIVPSDRVFSGASVHSLGAVEALLRDKRYRV
jgi:hypothetical protein